MKRRAADCLDAVALEKVWNSYRINGRVDVRVTTVMLPGPYGFTHDLIATQLREALIESEPATRFDQNYRPSSADGVSREYRSRDARANDADVVCFCRHEKFGRR
jgi:hypothetical protein